MTLWKMITSIIWFKGVLHPWKWCSRGVYLCNDVVCDRKGGATSLVTPDSTGQVPAAVSPRFPPLVFFFFFFLSNRPSIQRLATPLLSIDPHLFLP